MTAQPTTSPTSPETSVLPNNKTAVENGDSLVATVDDQGQVLELVFIDSTGMYARGNHEWHVVDTDTEQPTIDDLEWYDVTPEFVSVYDEKMDTQDHIERDEVVPYDAASA